MPEYIFLYPHETKPLLALSGTKYREGFSFKFSYVHTQGKPDVKHNDEYIYRLPFPTGKSFICEQGFDGKLTHKGMNAVDFAMPQGTPVLAAREGVVVGAVDIYKITKLEEKYKDKGNVIFIEHDDGTMARYGHLKENGILVKLGDRVKRGQQIGLSGNTGYSTGPHLHFDIISALNAVTPVTHRFRFRHAEGVDDKPVEQKLYTAVD